MKNLLTDAERSAWTGLVVTQGRVFRAVEEDLKKNAGLAHTEYEVLLRLYYAEERRERIQTLAAKSLLSRSGTSRAVDRMVKAGYVKRVEAAEDGRGAYAVLTEVGRRHFEKAEADHLKLVKSLYIAKFSEAELKTLGRLFDRFRERAPEKP